MENIEKLKPRAFTKFCMSLGMVPSSYTSALTYEEQLLWFCSYLENEVIPTVNNNAEAVTELQNLYVQLKDYVDNYFENLDVQEEINNKLDDMAESGELAEIIAQYLDSQAIIGFNTCQALSEATNLADGSFARTLGKENYLDGFGAFYKIRTRINTDDPDGYNLIVLTETENLVAEKTPDNNTPIKNVKQFGAKGDGETDDTVAIVNALNSLQDGESLYFPAGDYIVYNDYVDNTTNPSYDLDKILKLEEKKNITLYGDNKASRIRPSNQGVNASKVYYPCTLTINKCENILVKDLVIESKGENYGNADAGISATIGDDRQEFVMANGGSAILITASKGIELKDCDFRLCGSCGVVYHSDVADCLVENCFANAASLGYAGFAIDTFTYNSSLYNGKITYKNCIVHKETLIRPEDNETQIGSSTYSSKGGFVTEGSEVQKLNVSILDCEAYDCYGNSGNNYWEGVAFYGEYTNFDIERCKTDNVFAAVRIGIFTWESKSIIKDNNFNCKYAGIVMRSTGSNLPTSVIDIINNKIKIDTTTTPPDNAVEYLNYHSCIVDYQGYNTNKLTVLNNYFEGGYALYQTIHISSCKFAFNTINCTNGIYTQGGGNLTITDNEFNITNLAITMSNIDGQSVVGQLTLKFCKNYIESTTNKSCLALGSLNQTAFDLTVDDNKLVGCSIMIPSLSASTNGLKQSLNCMARCIANNELAGSYTIIGFDLKGITYVRNNNYIFKDNDYNNKTIESIHTFDANTSTLKIYINGDVRSKYTVDKFYQIIETN